MEEYVGYILAIASVPPDSLKPVYPVLHTDPMDERVAPHLKGYGGEGPVHIGNDAVTNRSMMPMAASFWRRRRCSLTAGCRGLATKRCFDGLNRLE